MMDQNNQPENKKARSVGLLGSCWPSVCGFKLLHLHHLHLLHLLLLLLVVVVVVSRMDGTLSPVKKGRPESVPRVMFTGFEPMEVQHYTKVSVDQLQPLLCSR